MGDWCVGLDKVGECLPWRQGAGTPWVVLLITILSHLNSLLDRFQLITGGQADSQKPSQLG